MRKKMLLLVMFVVTLFSLSFAQQVYRVRGQSSMESIVNGLIVGIGVQDPGLMIDVPNRVIIDNNWSEVEKAYEWCGGSGTEKDPYVIENIKIDSEFGGTCLKIENSEDFFVVRNCMFERSGSEHEQDSGVQVKYSANGVIMNNNFSMNYDGINVYRSSHVTVLENAITGAHNDTKCGMGKAVYVFDSHDITVQRNYALNHYDGIGCWESLNLDIKDNIIVNLLFGYDVENGVYFFDTNYSSIVDNTLYGVKVSTVGGVSIQLAGEDTFGIMLQNSYFNWVHGNVFLEAGSGELMSGAIGGYEFFGIVAALTFVVILSSVVVKRKYKLK